MLRYSKHERKGLSAPILREPQDDSALFLSSTVISSGSRGVCAAKQTRHMHGDEVALSPHYATPAVPRNDKAFWCAPTVIARNEAISELCRYNYN